MTLLDADYSPLVLINADAAAPNALNDTLFVLPQSRPHGKEAEWETLDSLFVRFTQQVAGFLNYSKKDTEALQNTLPQIILHPEDFAKCFGFVEQAADIVRENGVQQTECRFRRQDGQWRWILCKHFVFPSAAPEPRNAGEMAREQILIYLCDTTESRSRQERLRLLESVVINANDVILITEAEPVDLPGPRVVYINEAFARMTGYAPEDIIGKTPRLLQGPETSAETRQFIREKLKAWEGFRAELLNYKKDGTPFWVELNVQPVADEKGWYTHWIAVQRETTERRQIELDKEKQLAEALERAEKERLLAEALDRADRDPLTNLFNHRAFHERLACEAQFAVSPANSLFVVLLDLDNFKFFNDAYGHLTGDTVLRRLARALQQALRPGDVLARMGGDEFAVMGIGLTPSQAGAMVERLKKSVGEIGYAPPGYDTYIPLSVSCGLAFFGEDSGSVLPMDVLKCADERLLRDKVGNQDYETVWLREQLRETVDGFAMLDALVTAVDNKDRYTRRHSEDVLLNSSTMGRALGFSSSEVRDLQVAALLHDVGKIGVPDRILRLPGRLSPTEYDAIKQHAAMSAILVGAVPDLANIVEAVHYHHERWDGSGYPKGLCGEEIPLTARILAVADAFSAMTTDRPYRKGLSHQNAREVLRLGAGTQWDARCVQAFLGAPEPTKTEKS